MPTQLPPITGNNELDQFNYDVSQALASNVGGGGTSDVTVSTDNQDRPVIGGLTLGYQDRFLETAYGTSANGANFSQTVGGLPTGSTTIYQGVRNQEDLLATNNPADFTWRLITGPVNSDTLMPSYLLTGGRRIDWSFGTTVPNGYSLDNGTVIDLDGFILQDGESAITANILSNEGNIFRNAVGPNKTLSAFVFDNGTGQVLTNPPSPGTPFIFYTWRRGDGTIAQVTSQTNRMVVTSGVMANGSGFPDIIIDSGDVATSETFTLEVEVREV